MASSVGSGELTFRQPYAQPFRSRMTLEAMVKSDEKDKETYIGVRSPDEARPLSGKIFLVHPPALDRYKLQGLSVSDKVWKRVYNLFYWYAHPEKEAFLIPETFSALYGSIFGECFGPQLFGEKNLQRIFQHFQEWIHIDLDPASFMRMQLRLQPAAHFRGVSASSPSYGKKSLEMKNHPLTFYLTEDMEEEEEGIIDALHSSFPHSPTHPTIKTRPQILKAEVRFQMYYLILRHFPTGMDMREMPKAWHEKYGCHLNPQSLYGSSLESLLQEHMKDLILFKKKSPVHSVAYPKLDIPCSIPTNLLKKVKLWDLYKDMRRMGSVESGDVEGERRNHVSCDLDDVLGDPVGAEPRVDTPLPPLSLRPLPPPSLRPDPPVDLEMWECVERCVSEKSGGVTLKCLNDYMESSKAWEIHMRNLRSNPGHLRTFLESIHSGVEISFGGKNLWIKRKDECWCSRYYEEVESVFEKALSECVPGDVGGGSPLALHPSTTPLLTSTPTQSLGGGGTRRSKKTITVKDGWEEVPQPKRTWSRAVLGEEEAAVMRGKELAELGARNQEGISLTQIVRHLEREGCVIGIKTVTELHEWVVQNQGLNFFTDCAGITTIRKNNMFPG